MLFISLTQRAYLLFRKAALTLSAKMGIWLLANERQRARSSAGISFRSYDEKLEKSTQNYSQDRAEITNTEIVNSNGYLYCLRHS